MATIDAPLAPPPDVPRVASGVELIGRYEDSGFKEPPYIARRSDGQMVQLAPLLYALAEEIDGRRDTTQIAESLSHRIQRGVDAGMVEMLLDEQLRRLGLVAERDGDTGEVRKLDPLLALKFRTKVVPARLVRAATTIFRALFWPPVTVAVVAGLIAVDAWLFGVHGISQGVRHVLYQPSLLFLLLGGVIVATAFHELGHATAVRYGGAEPGVMGVGVYIVWPAFYTDITDAYRLGKWGRLRADTGGMYFNAIFALAMTGAYLVTGFEPLLLLVVLQNFAIIQQSLPFLRLDGYYIVSDLTGVPDMLTRMRPVLASLLPWREPDDRVTELKPWVRRAVTGYVLLVVPVIVLAFGLMLVHAPRAFATAYDSLSVRYARLGAEPASRTAMDVFQMIVLALPCLGMLYTTGRIGGRAWTWSEGRGIRLAAAALAVAIVGFLWWPQDGAYRPITTHDRGTIVSAVRHLPRVARTPPLQAAPAPVQQQTEPQTQAQPATKPKAKAQPATRPRLKPGTTTPDSTATAEKDPTSTATTPSDTTSTQPQDDTYAPDDQSTTETAPAPSTGTTDNSGGSVYPGGE